MRAVVKSEVAVGDLVCLLMLLSVLGVGVGVFRPDRSGSTAEKGLALDGVPDPVLAGVDGEGSPLRELRAPDRGVMLPLSLVMIGDRTSSLRGAATCDSVRAGRRGGLVAGDAGLEPASLGVSGLFVLRKLELSAGVKGLGLGVLLLALSWTEGAIVGFRVVRVVES